MSVEEAMNEIIGIKIVLDTPIKLTKGQHIFAASKKGISEGEQDISGPLEVLSIQEGDEDFITSFTCFPHRYLTAENKILLNISDEENSKQDVFIIKSVATLQGFARKNKPTRERL